MAEFVSEKSLEKQNNIYRDEKVVVREFNSIKRKEFKLRKGLVCLVHHEDDQGYTDEELNQMYICLELNESFYIYNFKKL